MRQGGRRVGARWRHGAVGAWALAGAIACAEGATEPVDGQREAERRWKAGIGAATAYEMRQQRLCYCLRTDTVRLTVAGGRITAAVNERTGVPLPEEERQWYRSVEQLFAELEAVPAAGGRIREVTFHPTEGYPVQLSVDPIPMAADDEVDWRSRDVRRVSVP